MHIQKSHKCEKIIHTCVYTLIEKKSYINFVAASTLLKTTVNKLQTTFI